MEQFEALKSQFAFPCYRMIEKYEDKVREYGYSLKQLDIILPAPKIDHFLLQPP